MANAQRTRSSSKFAPFTSREATGKRVVEYVIIIKPEEKSILERKPGVSPLERDLTVELASRFPAIDYEDHKFEGDYQYFAFPTPARFLSEPKESTIHSFVQTKQDGTRIYGFCYTKYQEVKVDVLVSLRSYFAQLMSSGLLREGKIPEKFFFPICTCLLTGQPFFKTINKHLIKYRDKFETQNNFDQNFAKEIWGLFSQVPWPASNLDTKSLPSIDLDYAYLFSNLDPLNILKVLNAVLFEQKIIIFAQLSHLTEVIECLISLIYPLIWPHVYIPLLPISLSDYTESPVPFIMGIDKSSPGWQNLSPSEEVMIVDIESNVVFSRRYLEQMPVRHKQALHSIIKKFSITCIYPELPQDPITPDPLNDSDSENEQKSTQQRQSEKNIQMVYSEDMGWHLVEEEADTSEKDEDDTHSETPSDSITALRVGFVNVWISLLKLYKDHVILPTRESMAIAKRGDIELLDKDAYLVDLPNYCQSFMSSFIETQLFTYLVEERLIRQEDDFFDMRVDKFLTKYEQRLVKYKTLHYSSEVQYLSESKIWKKAQMSIFGTKLEIKSFDSPKVEVELTPKTKLHIYRESSPNPFTFSVKFGNTTIPICFEKEPVRRKWIKVIKSRMRQRHQQIRVKRTSGVYDTITQELQQKREIASAQKLFSNPSSVLMDSKRRSETVLQIITNQSKLIAENPVKDKDDSEFIEKLKRASRATVQNIKSNLGTLISRAPSVTMEDGIFIGQVLRAINQVIDSPNGDTKITIPEKPSLPSTSVNTPEKLEQLRKTIGISLDRVNSSVKKLLDELEIVTSIPNAVSIAKRISTVGKAVSHAIQVVVVKTPNSNLRTDISLYLSSNNLTISPSTSNPPQRSLSSESIKESLPPAKPSKSATMPIKSTSRPTTTVTSPISSPNAQRPVSTWISTSSHPPKPNAPPPTLGGQRTLPASMNRNSSEPVNNNKPSQVVRNQFKSESDMLSSFIQSFEWKHLTKSLVDVENQLKNATTKEDIVFYAQISRNVRRLLDEKTPDGEKAADNLIVVRTDFLSSLNLSSVTPDKTASLKNISFKVHTSVINSINKLKEEFESATNIARATSISKIVRNVSRILNESRGLDAHYT